MMNHECKQKLVSTERYCKPIKRPSLETKEGIGQFTQKWNCVCASLSSQAKCDPQIAQENFSRGTNIDSFHIIHDYISLSHNIKIS